MSSYPVEEAKAYAIRMMMEQAYDDDIAKELSEEFNTKIHVETVRAWRRKAGLPKAGHKTRQSVNKPICNNFNDLIKLMKPHHE